MNLTELVKSADWPTVHAALTQGGEAAPLAQLVLGAFYAGDPDVRRNLVALVRERPPETGLGQAHLAALTGQRSELGTPDAEELGARPSLNLMNGVPVQGWTPLHTAAALGHTEVADALLEHGADLEAGPSDRPLEVAVIYEQYDMVRHLLERGTRPSARTVCSLRPSMPDDVLAQLIESGLDLDDSPPGYTLADRVGSQRMSPSDRVAWLRQLVTHGFTLSAQVLWSLLDALRDEAEVPGVLTVALELVDVDVTAPIVVDPRSTKTTSLIEVALREWPLAAVKRLAAAGAAVPSMRVKSSWLHGEAKAEWLDAQGLQRTSAPTLAEFMTFNDVQLTPERIVSALVGEGASLAGLTCWAPEERMASLGLEVEGGFVTGESSSEDHEHLAEHRLEGGAREGVVRAVDYEVRFRSGDARVAATFEALKAAWTERLGKPKGRKNVSWTVPGAKLTMRIKELSNPWHELLEVVLVTLSAERETRPAAPAPPPTELAQALHDDLRAFAPDAFDPCPEIVEVEVTQEDDAVRIAVTLRFDDEETWATVVWDNDIVDADGLITSELRAALSDAIGVEVHTFSDD